MGKKKDRKKKQKVVTFDRKRAQKDLHKMLRRFGYNADKSVMAYLENVSGHKARRFRITIEDLTEPAVPDAPPFVFKIDGEIRLEKAD